MQQPPVLWDMQTWISAPALTSCLMHHLFLQCKKSSWMPQALEKSEATCDYAATKHLDLISVGCQLEATMQHQRICLCKLKENSCSVTQKGWHSGKITYWNLKSKINDFWTNTSNIADALTRTSELEIEGLQVSSNWTCASIGRERGKQKAHKTNPACFPLTHPPTTHTHSQHGWCTGWKAGVPLWSNKFQILSTEKKKFGVIEKLHHPGKSWELLKKMFSFNRVKNHGS